MADKKNPKIGDITLNDAQKEAIAEFVDSDMFKLIKNVIRPKRQIRLGQLDIRTAITLEQHYEYRGKIQESDWLVDFLTKTAKEYNADQDKQE